MIQKFGFINGVDNVNWPPYRDLDFRISVRWPIYIINSVDKTKFLYTTSPPTQHHSFFRNYPLHSVDDSFVASSHNNLWLFDNIRDKRPCGVCHLQDYRFTNERLLKSTRTSQCKEFQSEIYLPNSTWKQVDSSCVRWRTGKDSLYLWEI